MLLAAILSVAASACSNRGDIPKDSHAVGKVKYVTCFPKKIELKGVQVELVPQSYGCEWVNCIVDTTLILADAHGKNCFFHAYSTTCHEYIGHFIRKGRGPDEFLDLPHLIGTERPNEVCLADSYTGAIAYKDLDSLVKFGYATSMVKSSSKVFNKGASSLEYIDESIRILEQIYFSSTKKVISFYGIFKDTTLLRRIDVFDFTDNRSKTTGLDAIPMHTVYSPKTQKIFCVLCYFNQINVYSLSGEDEFTICVSPEMKLYTQTDFDNTSRITRRRFYHAAVCSDQYLFALYYNLPSIEYETNKEAFPVIQVFTLDGKPVAELAVKEKLSDIEYDPVHNRLYGFTGEEKLFFYNLSEVTFD